MSKKERQLLRGLERARGELVNMEKILSQQARHYRRVLQHIDICLQTARRHESEDQP